MFPLELNNISCKYDVTESVKIPIESGTIIYQIWEEKVWQKIENIVKLSVV